MASTDHDCFERSSLVFLVSSCAWILCDCISCYLCTITNTTSTGGAISCDDELLVYIIVNNTGRS